MERWSPAFAPHVHGSYTARTFDQGMPEPQKVKATCTICAAEWQTTCSSGNVRRHIATFATLHLHRDPLS